MARLEQLAHVTPVHAHKGKTAIAHDCAHMTERRRQKGRKCGFAHLADSHGKLAVTNFAEPRDMLVSRHVIGRIGDFSL
jgi:hypothetical protein